MSAPVSVAVIGLGRMGCQHAENLAWRVPGARLALVVDADQGRAREQAARLGEVAWSAHLEDALHDVAIQAVVIAAPTPAHADMVEAAIAAGKDLFCEKPLTLDRARSAELSARAAARGVRLQVGFHRRFDPDYREVKRQVESGAVGRIYLFRESCRDMRPPSFEYIENSGGIFADVTLHDFDVARWLVGEVAEVTAVAGAVSDPRFLAAHDVDNAVVVLRFAGGALGVIDNSRVAGYGYECSAELVGERKTLRIGGRRSHQRLDVEELSGGWARRGYVTDFVERFHRAYLAEIEAFVAAVRDDRMPEVTGEDATCALDLAEAARRSWQERRPIRIPEDE
ncbi:MAG TPA: Gfo/Idh/MocA family oxidoreductase [Candidatus Dormibacteraeota bacterium]|nr:Gfo/Idh/MocA family oxidoreductase [Candidatus Dormibacteraeota bacterium]